MASAHRFGIVAPTLAALAALAAAPLPALAQGADDGSFDGEIVLGYRLVDVGGADRKYREDINQEEGPVLFRLDLDLVPAGERKVADRIELNVSDLGSQPFESIHFGVRKFGMYKFELDRRESEYFYEDILLPPELADIRSSTGGDFHHFDFERVRNSAKLELELSAAAKLSFGFDEFTRRGGGTTTVDLSRDEFEIDTEIDEQLQTSTLGFSYAWDKVTLILEERLREYDNAVGRVLPGFSQGESPGPATLDFYFFDQPYDYETNEHAVRVLASPNDKLDLRFSAELHDLSMNLDAEERYRGLAFNGSPLVADLTGGGDIQRDLEFYDLDVTYLISDRVGITGSARQYTLDQDGGSTLGGDVNTNRWEIDTTAFEGGVIFFVGDDASVGAGLSFESRDVAFTQLEDGEGVDESGTTDSDGYYVNASWRPSNRFELTAKADFNSIDDPITLATPTDRARYRARARYNWENGFSLSGIYQFQDYENDPSGWAAEVEKTSLRLGYRQGDIDASVGYTLISIDRQIDSLVNDTLLFNDLYQADADFIDGRLRWTVNERVAVGGSARLYQNDGSFALERDDYRAFVEVGWGESYVLGLAYRSVDYDENEFDFDDYDVDIVELSIGYRF